MQRAKGVIFDLYGTLTDGRLEAERAALYTRLAAILGVPELQFCQLMRETFPERCRGAFATVHETLSCLSTRLGVTVDEKTLDAAVGFRLAIERRLATPRHDAVAVLTTLRDLHVPFNILSDCGPESRSIWPDHPFSALIAHPVFSFEVFERKPHPSLYRTAAARIGLDPKDCIYVGDGGSFELTGALAAGMQVVQLAIPGETWGDELRFDPDHAYAGRTIASLSAVLDLCGLTTPSR
jgi:putative hydrolase of the HAD superfamily